MVTMTYVLRENDENGPILQETTNENPFQCIFGMHQLLPKFEENLIGKEPGDSFSFKLSPDEAYGRRSEDNVVDLDKNIFCQNGVLLERCKVGAQFMMQSRSGQPFAGVVVAITDDYVRMDFNHDLADKYLHFSGSIIDVRETTDDDFKCGGCDGGCGSGCDGTCSCDSGCGGCC